MAQRRERANLRGPCRSKFTAKIGNDVGMGLDHESVGSNVAFVGVIWIRVPLDDLVCLLDKVIDLGFGKPTIFA